MAEWRWRSAGKRTTWVTIAKHAFAHFNVKRDGSVTLYEIAVHEDCKRMGMARQLMSFLVDLSSGCVELKTDADNAESNAFYRAVGFMCVGQKTTKSGKLVNIYQRWK